MTRSKGTRIGVISDTHGLLRPEAVAALAGVDLILHAGDVGSEQVLEALREIAPVTAVRGNNDKASWAAALKLWETVEFAGRSLYMIHDIADLDVSPAAAGFAAVITGHSHKPGVRTQEGVLFMNPGSAGPRRFKLPITLGTLELRAGVLHAEIQQLRIARRA